MDDDPWGEEPAWARDDDEADASEKDSEGFDGFGAQHILVLIDCRPSMFVPCISADDEQVMTPFDAALLACEKVMRLRVHYVATSKAGKRDGVGIMLYGTKPRPVAITTIDNDEDEENERYKEEEEEEDDSDESDDEDGQESSPLSSTHTLLPIAPPGIQGIRSLRDCLPDRDRGIPRKRNLEEEYADKENASGPSNIAQRMGHMTLCPLRSALHEASKAFVQAKCVKKTAATSKSPADAKTVWIFTNDDDPCHGNEDEKKLMVIVAKDAVENCIDIHVWPLPRSDSSPFRRGLFFDNITTSNDDYRSFSLERDDDEEGAFNLDDMLDDVQRQWKRVRRVCSLPLLLPDWRDNPDHPGIMVDFFGIVQIQKKPQSVSIHQQTNKMTEKTTQVVMKDTGEVISDGRSKARSGSDAQSAQSNVDRIRTFASFGGDRVPLTRDEVALIKKQSNAADRASLILLGFKPIGAISVSQLIDRAFLVYPNEDAVKGSKAAFANLHAAMIRKHVMAIGELLQRATATSRLVALYPQQEKRELVEEGGAAKQVTPPGLVLVQLPFEDDCRAVEADLGAAAASKETVEAAMDLVKSQNLDGVELGYSFENAALSRFWGYIESVAIGTPMKDEEDETKVDYESVKQVAGQQIEAFRNLLPEDVKMEKSRKRKLVVDDGEGPNWLELYKTGSLSDCTAPLLKTYLRGNGLKLSGKKADLIERISQHLEEEMANNDSAKPSVKMEEC